MSINIGRITANFANANANGTRFFTDNAVVQVGDNIKKSGGKNGKKNWQQCKICDGQTWSVACFADPSVTVSPYDLVLIHRGEFKVVSRTGNLNLVIMINNYSVVGKNHSYVPEVAVVPPTLKLVHQLQSSGMGMQQQQNNNNHQMQQQMQQQQYGGGMNPHQHQQLSGVVPGVSGANITPIASLSPYNENFCLEVRVIRKGDIRTFRKRNGGDEGKLFNVEVKDARGDEIKITGFGDQVDSWYSFLTKGQTYKISNGRVKLADKRFSPPGRQYEITLSDSSNIQTSANSGISGVQYNFVPISSLTNCPPKATVDLAGVIIGRDDAPNTFTSKAGKECTKLNFTIADQSSSTVAVTVWGKDAEAFTHQTGAVVCVKGATVSDFGGRTVSLGFTSLFEVDNNEVPEVVALQTWYTNSGANTSFTSLSSRGGAGAGAPAEPGFIRQICNSELVPGKPGVTFSICGYITYVSAGQGDKDPWYPACARSECLSNKKLDDNNTCKDCSQSSPNPRLRYILNLTIADGTNSHMLSAFSDVATKILGVSEAEASVLKSAGDFANFTRSKAGRFCKAKIRGMAYLSNDSDRRVRATCVDVSFDSEINFGEETASALGVLRKLTA